MVNRDPNTGFQAEETVNAKLLSSHNAWLHGGGGRMLWEWSVSMRIAT